MRTQKTSMIAWMILWAALPGLAADNATPPPYMGQEPPGLTPKRFAPGLVSLANRLEHGLCLSKDGRECYIAIRAADWSTIQIMVMRYENGQWTSPVQAPFSNTRSSCPSLADNDQSLYFTRNVDIWKVRRTTQGWSQPEIVAAPASSSSEEYSCQISSLGSLWICSWRPGGCQGGCDVWRVQYAEGNFTNPTNMIALNTTANDCYPAPGPNEDYVVFHSERPGGFGGADLYISFPDGRGGWIAPRNLGPTINSSRNDVVPYISPDHKYLFFCRDEGATDEDIYWVRVEAFLPDPNGPVLNVTTDQRFGCIQAAVNHAESGQVIQISPGTYEENLILPNMTLTIRSADAQEPAVVAKTTLVGDKESPVVKLLPGDCVRTLRGLTITGGAQGALDSGPQLQLTSCVIQGRRD